MNREQSRRDFLNGSVSVLASAALARSESHAAETSEVAAPPLIAVIIGDTGRGDYGHELDTALIGIQQVRVVAVADPDAAGREKVARRAGAARQYADYRQMLDREKPGLAVVAPRWSERHRDMAMAAIRAGAHVLMEKPITVTLAEADELLAAANRASRKVAVMHQMRLSPAVVHLRRRVAEGLIGALQQIHAFGKQDARAGGEDMLVLGVHLFDLMRMFAGNPRWCTAHIRQGDHDITTRDAHRVREDIGPVAGDQVFAQFAFENGVDATFTSRTGMRDDSGYWGMELVGSGGAARIVADIWPRVYAKTFEPWKESGREVFWKRIPDDPTLAATPEEQSTRTANRRVVDDWLGAIRDDREPVCSGENSARALEMVMAAYEAALSGGRVQVPLKERNHPLLTAK